MPVSISGKSAIQGSYPGVGPLEQRYHPLVKELHDKRLVIRVQFQQCFSLQLILCHCLDPVAQVTAPPALLDRPSIQSP